jgi:RNA polymerase-binding transcription factor DksA
VITPIGSEDSLERKRSDQILEFVIQPAVKAFNYESIRADHISEPGVITHQIIEHLYNDELVIVDLTSNNPNVTYELALRHAFQKHVIQIKDSSDTLPFDIQGIRTIDVDYRFVASMEKCKKEIIEQIETIEKSPDKVISPVTFALDYLSIRKSEDPKDKMIAQLSLQVQNLSIKLGQIESLTSRLTGSKRVNPGDYVPCRRCGHQKKAHLFYLGQGIDATHPCNLRAECGCFDFEE